MDSRKPYSVDLTRRARTNRRDAVFNAFELTCYYVYPELGEVFLRCYLSSDPRCSRTAGLFPK
jgi:hypothetical protein